MIKLYSQIVFWTTLSICFVFFNTAAESTSFYQKSPENANHECYVTNTKTGEHWQLVWEDDFTSNNLSSWTITNETNYCHYFFKSCSTPQNVHIQDGQLVLTAEHRRHYSHHFTGASLFHRDNFTYGRYEVRLAFPVGMYLQSFVNLVDHFGHRWFDPFRTNTFAGQTNIVLHNQFQSLTRGFSFQNGTVVPAYTNLPETFKLNHFHVYGIEWNQSLARFFLDEEYSEPIIFGDMEASEHHQIWLSIGVLEGFGSVFENYNVDKLGWVCPALIIDYVRVFRRVDAIQPHLICHFQTPASDEILEPICRAVLGQMKQPEVEEQNSGKLNVIVFTLSLVLSLFIVIGFFWVFFKITTRNTHTNAQMLVSYSNNGGTGHDIN